MSAKRRAILLHEAEELVNGDRDAQYGPPIADFTTTAALWSAFLGVPIKPTDVAVLMMLVKVSRLSRTPDHEDSWKDIAGYAACGWDCLETAE